ncbi:hypothetical protein WJX84_004065 [Apatococcus fuscideae]|uniref:Uncharacterized protein n=1 Tax=Apatococcus fuscideae TaxID=2026836 RepID=A0AAW1SXX0_9CHLO
MTDACLRADGGDSTPLHLPLLIHFDLPMRKDAWLRRLGWVLGSKGHKGRTTGIAMYCVVAGEAADFRVVEGFLSSGRIEVMPVQVEEIFVQ